MTTRRWALGIMAVLALLPAVSLLQGWSFLADPLSELPVRLWAFETFGRIGLFGGMVDTAAWPATGVLNNPDPLGTAIYLLAKPMFGRAGAWNLLVMLQLAATMVSGWALGKDLTNDDDCGVITGVALAFSPLCLAYCVEGAITDMLNLWPYPLAILFGLRALRRMGWKNGLLGGVFAGLGFVTCPYNFVVFSVILVPLLVVMPLAWRDRLVAAHDPLALANWRHWWRPLLAVPLGIGLTAGAYAIWMKWLMAVPGSQMAADAVASTRHAAPYPYLQPDHFSRYHAWLQEYFQPGKAALVVRDAGSRYQQTVYVGFLLPALGLLALLFHRRRAVVLSWWGIALFFALASTGPFLPINGNWHLSNPLNPVWVGLHRFFPAASMLLEPFRYGLGVVLALGVLAAMGCLVLVRWRLRWLARGMPLVLLAEVVLISPVPMPLQTARPYVPPVYWSLDQYVPPGAVIELPFLDKGTARFNRMHFLQQLIHGRPIADQVMGFHPPYLLNNPLTLGLLYLENPVEVYSVKVADPEQLRMDDAAAVRDAVARLVDDGFAAIIVDPEGYTNIGRRQLAMYVLAMLGTPKKVDDRLLYLLDPARVSYKAKPLSPQRLMQNPPPDMSAPGQTPGP